MGYEVSRVQDAGYGVLVTAVPRGAGEDAETATIKRATQSGWTARIEAAEPYSDEYDDTVARNLREQDADARLVIANPLPAIDGYEVVLLGGGLWNVRPPMIMRTFAESYDFTGEIVLPVVIYAVSGLGRAGEVYAQACPGAIVGEGGARRSR